MSNLFGNMTNDGLEESKDVLGGGFQALESDIYEVEIKAFYAGKSKNGATSVTLIGKHGDREYRETFYVTNKAGENFFVNKKTGKKAPLPGFTVVDDICLITTGEPLSAQDPHVEEKMINIYDYDQKKEVPTSVPMITSVIGKKVSLGILKELVNKNAKNGAGDYVATAETRTQNAVDKVFHPELKVTVPEARKGIKTAEEAKFFDAWLEKNKGQTRDNREIKDGEAGNTVTGGKPPQAAPAAKAERKSLFG